MSHGFLRLVDWIQPVLNIVPPLSSNILNQIIIIFIGHLRYRFNAGSCVDGSLILIMN